MEISQRIIETIAFATIANPSYACCMPGSAWIIPQQPQNKSVGQVLFLFPFYSGETEAQRVQVICHQKRAEYLQIQHYLNTYLLSLLCTGPTPSSQLSKPSRPDTKALTFNSCGELSGISLLYSHEGVEKERHTWGHCKLQLHILSPFEITGSFVSVFGLIIKILTSHGTRLYHHATLLNLNH